MEDITIQQADPSVALPPMAPAVLPFDADKWQGIIGASKAATNDRVPAAQTNVGRYAGLYAAKGTTASYDTVYVPSDFWNVEQKRAQLFYRVPDTKLVAETEESRPVAPLFTKILNKYLGPEHTNSLVPMSEAIFDVICPIGYGVVKVGYQPIVVQVDTGQVGLDGKPIMQSHAVDDRYYVKHIPAGHFLAPIEFTGFDFDDADWVGFEFWEDADENANGASSGAGYFDNLMTPRPAQGTGRYQGLRRRGVEVWYRATKFDTTVTDPRIIRTFTLMDGDQIPRKHENSPFQQFSEDGSEVGISGFAVKVLKIRPMSDTAFPPSDCEITRHIADEQSKGRTQALQHRNRSLPSIGYDAQAVTTDSLSKLQAGIIDAWIGFNGPQKEAMWPIVKAALSQDSYKFDEVSSRDLQQAWGLASNQLGQTEDTARTATELSLVQHNADTRLDYERGWVVWFFLSKIARSVAGLLQLFADRTQFVGILDAQGNEQFQAWDKRAIQGDFSFTILLGSQLRPDAAADLKRVTDWVNYSAKSPYINQQENWRLAAEAFSMPTDRLLIQPQPTRDEKLIAPIDIKDLDPRAPWYPNALIVLTQGGWTGLLPAAAPVDTNQLTEGSAPVADKLNQHVDDRSGLMEGGAAMLKYPVTSGVN